MKEKNLSVYDVFESIQGEGYHTGRPMVFIRFAGCNLLCSFCDTAYARNWSSGNLLLVDELVEKVKSYKSKTVCLTGGEPLCQDYKLLKELVSQLKQFGYYVTLETNGSIEFDKQDLNADWITISPKTTLFKQEGDELKVLYDGTQDLTRYEKLAFFYFYLQPILPMEEIHSYNLDEYIEAFQNCVAEVLKHPHWRLSFQAHKLSGIK